MGQPLNGENGRLIFNPCYQAGWCLLTAGGPLPSKHAPTASPGLLCCRNSGTDPGLTFEPIFTTLLGFTATDQVGSQPQLDGRLVVEPPPPTTTRLYSVWHKLVTPAAACSALACSLPKCS